MSATSTWGRPFAPLSHEVAATAEWLFELEVDWVDRAQRTEPVGLLIGEQPGPGSNPKLPLWPYPPGSAGGRLHRMSDIPVADYLLRLARVNLARQPVARWEPVSAMGRTIAVLKDLPVGTRVVLVGARARDALNDTIQIFGTGGVGWFEKCTWWQDRAAGRSVEVIAIPHPSARNPMYNDPAMVAEARRAVRWAARWDEA